MIKGNKVLLIAVMLFFAFNLTAQTAVLNHGQLNVSGSKIVDQSGNDVQLQGMSLFWSQWESEYYNANTIKWLKDEWCTNIVRAAMAVESGGYLTNPAAEKAKVKTVIDAAIANGMYVIVDWHDHAAENHLSSALTFFSEIAQEYHSYPNIIYEVYNEPLAVSWSNTIKPYCEQVIDTIRKYDNNNIIVCGTPNWSQDVDDAANDPITGETNIAYTLHYYAGTHGQSLRNKAITAMNSGIALIVTEFGNVNADGNGGVDVSSSNEWFDFLDQYNLTYCNWAVSNKDEGASILNPSVTAVSDWSSSDLTTAGTFMKARFTANCPDYSDPDAEPVIMNQPNNVSVNDGEEITFSVVALGVGLSYQWKKDGLNINGATSNTLVLFNVTENNEGNYTVVVTNVNGTVTSDVAILNIISPGPFYGSPLPIPGTIEIEDYDVGDNNDTYYDKSAGNEGNTYRTDDVDIQETADENGGYSLGWTEADEWLAYTVDVAATGDYDFEFRVGSAVSDQTFHIEMNGSDITNSVTVTNTGSWSSFTTVTLTDISLTEGVQTMRFVSETGSFNVNYIKVIGNDIIDCNGDVNGTATLDDCGVCAGGNSGNIPNESCTDCDGVVNGSASIDNCGVCAGGTTGITPGESCAVPVISNQPVGATIFEGESVSFSVTASNTTSYQWYFNNSIISGATNNTLTLSGVSSDQAGEYYVVVSNNNGNSTSTTATLSVLTQDPYQNIHSIPGVIEAEDYDLGGSGIAYYDNSEGNEGGSYRNDDVDIETNASITNIGWTATGEWLEYSVNVSKSSYYNIIARVAANPDKGEYHLELGGEDITSLVTVGTTGGWQVYENRISQNIYLTEGNAILRFYFDEGDFNLDKLTFEEVPTDCHGDLNGSASIDDCNVCSGGNTGIAKNSTCQQDCNGVFGGTAYLDNCNECVGGNTNKTACTQDCNGVYGGTAYLDNCDECVGGNTNKTACTQDCNGVYGGTAYLDNCNECVGGNTNKTACTQDCNGVFGGTAFLDNCNECVGGNTNKTACTQDCNGVFGGTAYLDNCNECVGGNTNKTACIQDCNGVYGGTAYLDNCNECVEGNTNKTACTQDCNGVFGGTAYLDNCNECVEGNTNKTACNVDCNGVFGGTAYLDNCNECVGGNTNKAACTQDCNGVFGGTAFLDNCNECVGGTTNKTACTQDCNGVFGGTAYLDNCNECVEGNTNKAACVQDCHGDFGGTAYTDVCGNCVSGNTGVIPVLNQQECFTSIDDELSNKTLKVYPNPSVNSFNVELEVTESATIEVYDLQGHLIEKVLVESTITKVGESWSAGTYIVKVIQDNKVTNVKVVKL